MSLASFEPTTMAASDPSAPSAAASPGNMKVFWACFMALVATSFFFGLRGVVVPELSDQFDLSRTQVGEILGVGLWPFAFSIIFFSLIIDRIGYKTTAYFAIIVHTIAVIGTVIAVVRGSQGWLYWSTFLVAIANGAVEGFINPVVATAFHKAKAKWLNILHAGWPAGLALGAAAGLLLGYGGVGLSVKLGICFVPVVIYALLVIPRTFPVQERVAAGVSYRDMLREVGAVGFFLIGWLGVLGIIQIVNTLPAFRESPLLADIPTRLWVTTGIALAVAALAFAYTRSPGNWMFILILITMPFLATTELGTDAWMTDLLEADLPRLAGWVFVLVSVIMTVLRFYAGPIVHRFSAIGLLVISAALAIVGLLFLGIAPAGVMVLAAIVYAFGKTFLWSTTLGVVSEQFPKGGALTLNGVSAVGVLGMGILGTSLMGLFLDRGIDSDLRTAHPALHRQVAIEKTTMFGSSPGVNNAVATSLASEDRETLSTVVRRNKKRAFIRQAALPTFLLVCYLGLFLHFRSRGGYKPVEIA